MEYFIGAIFGTVMGIGIIYMLASVHANASQKVCERLSFGECELIWVAK